MFPGGKSAAAALPAHFIVGCSKATKTGVIDAERTPVASCELCARDTDRGAIYTTIWDN